MGAMALHIDGAIAERAREQFGLLTLDQLAELGCTRQMRRSRLTAGVFLQESTHVLRLASVPRSWEQRLLAATLEAGPAAVISHVAACALWGFHGVRPGAVELSVPRSRRPRTLVGRIHRLADLLSVDIGHHRGLQVTTPSRSLIDAAPRLGQALTEGALDVACRDGLIRLPYLRWRLQELRRCGRPGIALLDRLLAGADGGTRPESFLERKVLGLIRDAALPPPRCQVHLHHGSGRIARVDLSYEEVRLVIEVAGHATHSTRRQRQADAEREARLVAQGWRVITFIYEDVMERPDYVVEMIALQLGLTTSGTQSVAG